MFFKDNQLEQEGKQYFGIYITKDTGCSFIHTL